MDFILASAHPARQLSLPQAPQRGQAPGAATAPMTAIWPSSAGCESRVGSASPLSPGVTVRQRRQSFRELVAALYVRSR